MGKGRDKRKKHEDPEKAVKRACRQSQKRLKGIGKNEGGDGEAHRPEGFNNEEAPEVTLNRIRKQESKTKTTREEENVNPPSPRANVVFTVNPARDNELLIFGGEHWNGEKTVAYNDLYFYHTKRNSWSQLVTAVNPPPRSSSQGVVYKHYLIIFGGEFVSQSQSQFLHFKDVWRFDARKFEWEEMKNLKGGPSSRSGHRMCLWRRNAVVFGGFYDNAQECHYYNDLWLLSNLDGAGKWEAIHTSPHGEVPHPRSGHNMAIHNDTLFVYGGYSTERFNRFKKSQATVHHDLWMIKLPHVDGPAANAELPVWTKVRLGGIPPPIQSGVSSAFKDKKMYLFGGVVDIESPGGKMVSSFSNDLFVFHMDTKRFYPVVLRNPPKMQSSGGCGVDGGRHGGGDLKAELRALQLESDKGSSSRIVGGEDLSTDTDDEDDDDDDDDDGDSSNAGEKIVGDKDPKELRDSFEVNRRGQIYPHRRMEAGVLVTGNTLYIFGGQFESGSKEITMTDLFSLNLNTCDTYRVLLSQDLSKAVWLGKDADSPAGSWESGSTVVSAMFDLDYDEDEDEDEAEALPSVPRDHNNSNNNNGNGEDEDDDDDEAPEAIPAELSSAVTPAREEIDGITTVRGKKGLQVHKKQLLEQLSAGFDVPTPQKDENAADFFARTKAFWLSMASEAFDDAAGRRSERRVEKQAARFANRRHEEARKLLEQLRLVEEREREEAKFFRERREQKEREWEEYEKQLAAQDDESQSNEQEK